MTIAEKFYLLLFQAITSRTKKQFIPIFRHATLAVNNKPFGGLNQKPPALPEVI